MPDKNKNEITVFAETNFRGQHKKFGIKTDDRRRHMYLIGKTGMGKSTALENMIIEDIRAGRGVAYVDPHGDVIEKIINYIPSSRVNDVVYFNPADGDYPIAFNILEAVDPNHKHLVASGLVGIFKKMWADSWGPRLEYVLRNAILALMDFPGSTLLGIMRILVDKEYRKKVIAKIQDPVVRSFWVDEYSKYPDRFQAEAIAPIQNKVGQFLSISLIRNIVGQVKTSIDVRDIMDNQKILLLNLAKGRVGEDASSLFGAMMITKIQLAAMERIDIPEPDRKDFYLYVDEFQNFATESFANILSEARKYRLNLIIAHQYIEQLDEKVAAAVFGNVGTIVCFRVGATDAEFLVKEFTPRFMEEDLVNLTKYDIYLKLMIDGVASDPFSARGLPPVEISSEPENNKEKIIKVSRERYATPRKVIEEKIARWSGAIEEEGKDNQEKKGEFRSGKSDRTESSESQKYKVICSECGADTEIFFQPDGVRPVYCKECLKKARAGLLKKKAPVSSGQEPKKQKPQSFQPPIKTAPPAIKKEETKSISLEEALKQRPVSFRKNKTSAGNTRRMAPEPTFTKPKAKEIFRPTRPEQPSQQNSQHPLKPGEVAKLNNH